MTIYYGTIQDDGRIETDVNLAQAAGRRVQIFMIDDAEEPQGITGAEILASGLVGMWEDRDDIGDSAEFAERIRRNWEHRSDRD